MMKHLNPTAEELAALLALPDDALLNVREAAAFLRVSPNTLNWNRVKRPACSPDFVRINGKTVRYRAGDLRAFVSTKNAPLGDTAARSLSAMAAARTAKAEG